MELFAAFLHILKAIYQKTIALLHQKRAGLPHPWVMSLFTVGLFTGMVSPYSGADTEIQLPSIGSVSPSSVREEKRLGSAWLKHYRRQIPTSSDPIITNYIEHLLNRLVIYSDLEDKTLSLVVANHPSLNAFAVPGGVIGVHTGLFNYAITEQQFASVLAHELGHLSQRHYARGVEKRKGQTIASLAGLLAGLVLLANSSGDAGTAALSATQALAIDQQLRFSRSFEREADRIGIRLLARSNMDPHGTAAMFEQMEKASRFSSKPPEFLLTHPLTTNRMVDAINIAREYPKKAFPHNINYQLVRVRAQLQMEQTPQHAIRRFQDELSGFSASTDASRYGLAVALTDNQQFAKAQNILQPLLKKYPNNTIIKIAYSDILAGLGNTQQAIDMIHHRLQEAPDDYPLAMQLSDLYSQQGDFSKASDYLLRLSKQHPETPIIWYQLAEISGLNNDISTLHKARAEYFILHADFISAAVQLNALTKKEKQDSPLYQYAKQRLKELETLRKESDI